MLLCVGRTVIVAPTMGLLRGLLKRQGGKSIWVKLSVSQKSSYTRKEINAQFHLILVHQLMAGDGFLFKPSHKIAPALTGAFNALR